MATNIHLVPMSVLVNALQEAGQTQEDISTVVSALERRIVTVDEAATKFSVSPWVIYRRVKRLTPAGTRENPKGTGRPQKLYFLDEIAAQLGLVKRK